MLATVAAGRPAVIGAQRRPRPALPRPAAGAIPRLSDDVARGRQPWQAQVEALGALLRAQRIAADLSLRELSERASVSNAYLSQLERGLHEPSLSVLKAIASALGMPLGPLLTRVGMLEEGDAARPRRRARPRPRSCATPSSASRSGWRC